MSPHLRSKIHGPGVGLVIGLLCPQERTPCGACDQVPGRTAEADEGDRLR
jgi:hypothetical protein